MLAFDWIKIVCVYLWLSDFKKKPKTQNQSEESPPFGEKNQRFFNSNIYIYTTGYPWPSNTVKSPGFFKPGSCLRFFLETFILQDYRSFSSSSSSIIFFFQDEELGWWDGWRDKWMERTTTTGQTKDII